MPTFGGVEVSDNVLGLFAQPRAQPRPGYGQIFSSAAENALGQLRYGLPYQFDRLTQDRIDPATEQEYQAGLARAAAAGARAAPAQFDDLTSGRVGFGRFLAENLTSSVPYMAGTVLGAAGGALVGGPGGAVAGAIAGGTPQFSASNVARAVEEQGGLSEQSAARAALLAPVQSAFDAAIGRYLPGVGKVLGDVAATQTGGFVRRTFTSIAKAGATEAVTEASQQLAERYAAGIPVGGADAVAEYVNAAATAFFVGGALGAGGGFRRTPALSKPVAAVNEADMEAYIAEPLMLPAPADFIGKDGGPPSVNPSGTQQLALPSPDQFREPDYVADTEGRVAPAGPEGERAIIVDRNQPQVLENTFEGNLTPEVRATLDQAASPAVDSLLASTPLSRGLEGTHLEPPAPGSPLAPDFDLAGTDLLRAGSGAEVVLPPRVDPETGAEIPFSDFLAERKKGLRGGFVQAVDAVDEMDLLGKVYDQLDIEADTRANTKKFGQRLGLLDENEQPTELWDYVKEQRAVAAVTAEVAPEPSQRVPRAPAVETAAAPDVADPAMDAALKAAGIQRQSAATKLQNLKTPADVFRALASDSLPEARGSNVAVTQVEKLARKLGLITDDDAMDVTPLGRETFLTTSEGLEETVSAAQQQGYTGAQASVFERGARSAAGEEAQTSFGSLDEFAAYQAGRIWADDFVANATTRTAAQTDAIRGRQAARTTGKAVDREVEASRRQLTPAQVQQRAANALIDASDLGAAGPEDVAGLFRMVREGASTFEVGRAIEAVQAGKSLFEQGSNAAPALSPLPVRGQPQFREMNTPDRGPSKAAQRASTQTAVETKRQALRGEIDAAYASEDITPKERLGLIWRLVRDDFRGVVDRLPGGPLRNDMDVSRRGFLAGVAAVVTTGPIKAQTKTAARTEATKQLQMFLKAGDVISTLRHLEAHGANAGYRFIARRLLAGGGWERVTMFTAEPIREGLYGTAKLKDDGSSSVTLFGDNGMAEETVLHELIHAYVQQRWAGLSVYSERNERLLDAQADRQDKVIREFQKLWDQVGAALKATNPDLVANESWADQFYNDPDEALAWMMTNQQAQDYLRSVDVSGERISTGTSLWDKFVEWLAKLLGSTTRQASALDELLKAGHAILDAGKDVRTGEFNVRMAEGIAKQAGRTMERFDSAANRTATAANEATKSAAAVLDKVVGNLDVTGMGAKARRVAMGWITHNQLDRAYGEQVPGSVQHSEAHRERDAILARVEKLGVDAYQEFEKFERASPNGAEWLGKLMALSTKYHIDPDKAWEEHTQHGFVTDENGVVAVDPKRAQENAQVGKLYAAAQKLKNDLSRGDGQGIKLYNRLRALNEAQNYMHMASRLHRLVAGDRELMLGVENALINPVDAFMRDAGALTDPAAIREFWLKALDDQVAAVTAFTRGKQADTARSGVEADMRALREHLAPIDLQISSIAEAKKAVAQGPYFHLGRFGEHFASATIVKGADGKAKPEALKAAAEAIEQGNFGTAEIAADETRPKFSIRFEKKDQADRFAALLGQLERQGHIEKGSALAGPRALAGNYGVQEGLPEFVTALLQRVETSDRFTVDSSMSDKEKAALLAHKEAVKQDIRDQWIESQPDNAISRVLTKRYAVPGYDPNMMRSFAHRWRVGATHIANTSTAPKFDRAMQSLEAQYRDELQVERMDAQGNEIPRGDPYVTADIMRELRLRDARTAINETVEGLDTLRAVTNVYFLGMSPAYGLINMTQLGVTALPEMAKKHGYAKSFAAMRRATGPAIAVIKAVASEARELGWRHYGDVSISDNVLRKAGLDEQTRKFVIDMLATGTIDIGSMARALGQISDPKGLGGGTNTALKLGSMVGLYTETASRLITALAARDLHGGYGPDASAYAAHTVSQSMFDYQSWNTARQLGKRGILGPVTPLLTQFMSYQVQLGEKLYAEFMDAAGRAHKGDTPEQAKQRKTEARRFLMGHLTAVTALAGSLGWPLATVFATIIERLVDAFGDDDEPYDATAAWRGFLAETLGKGMGEVVARGLPRAAGFDISSRAGEQNLIPFSEFLADRRPWKEAVESSAGRSLGAAPSMVSNIITGGGKLADGDLIGGLKDMVPVALKGPAEFYRMTQAGYVDSKGNRLPLTPTASSYLWQLLGFAPSEKAEYSEARGDQAARRGEITREAGRLRRQILREMAPGGSRERAAELVREAQAFDADNPAFAVIPGLMGAARRQQQTRARAVGLQTPIGVTMKDVAGQDLTRYANVNYTQ